jgi:hypothetical protein
MNEDIAHCELAESERVALRHYADGLDDWAFGVLIESAVWNVERLEAQLVGAVETLERIRDHANSAEDPALLAQHELNRIQRAAPETLKLP